MSLTSLLLAGPQMEKELTDKIRHMFENVQITIQSMVETGEKRIQDMQVMQQ